MEGFGPPGFDAIPSTVRKKRSQVCRRPKADSQLFPDSRDHSSSSLTPLSDDVSKISGDETADINSKIKEFSLNQNMPSTVCNERSCEGVLAPATWKSTSKAKEFWDSESRSANEYSGRYGEGKGSEQSGALLDALANENKVQKVKLKVGGITRTIHAKSASNGESSVKSSRSSDSSKSQQKQTLQGNLEEEHFVSEKQTRLQGVPWKDFSKGGFILGKGKTPMGKAAGKNTSEKLGDKPEPIRKSKRASKRRVLRGEFDEDEEDDEIRYLEKLKSKTSGGHREEDEESSAKLRNLSTIGTPKAVTDEKKSRSVPGLDDTDYEDEEEPLSDSLAEDNNKKRQLKKESLDSLMNGKREMALTTRQRALQSSKEGSSAPGANGIEFPDGLPPPPSRKQKEQLTEVEQQLKKAEAAQRRRMQVEKAARESEAEAIRKILGQESSRKKQEEKNKKRQEELAQERAANAVTPAPDTVRVVMGPTGTVMTFPAETGIPKILDQKPISYPPPREKCAGPSCTNPYKYRDSKSKLPLCSLKCYKAVQGQNQAEPSGTEPSSAEPNRAEPNRAEPTIAEPTIAERGRAERSRVESNCWRYQSPIVWLQRKFRDKTKADGSSGFPRNLLLQQ